jgi:hydrogenase-4 component B
MARPEIRFGPLSDLILAVIAFTGLAGSPYMRGYMAHMAARVDMRLFWIAYSWLMMSMAMVVLAANVQTFLVAWEVMSISSFLLVATDSEPQRTRRAALIYLAATRIGTALLAGGFLWAHAITGSWTFAEWHLAGVTALGPGLLVLFGLGIKAGMWPFHLWLPIAHPAAPAPVSAVMSGVMVKIAVAVIVRLFVTEPAFVHPAFGYLLATLGAVGAAWGILFAIVQHDIKRMLALHTVENIGLILGALGGCLVAKSFGLVWAAQLALAGALLHVVNHAVFKYLLFLGAGAVDSAAGTHDLGVLGGLGRRMPTTFACFVIGAASICALPPLSGFASEWMIYQAALAVSWQAHASLVRFAGLLAITGLALIGALVVTCFVKTIGVTFQGQARSPRADHAREVGSAMRASQVILAVACVALGLGAPLMLRLVQPIVGAVAAGVPPVVTAWTLPLYAALLIMLLTAGAIGAWLRSVRQASPPRIFVTWDCGFGALGPRAQVTSISFAQPVVRMFGKLFHYALTRRLEGTNLRLFPLEITAEASIEAAPDRRLYEPVVYWFGRLADRVLNLQQGSIHRYLFTMLLTLGLLLVIAGGR